MSGPVASGLAQLDDALKEMGLSKGLLVMACRRWLRAEHEWLDDHPAPNGRSRGSHRIGAEDVRQLWTHLLTLEPDLAGELLYNDWMQALHENEMRRRFGRNWRFEEMRRLNMPLAR